MRRRHRQGATLVFLLVPYQTAFAAHEADDWFSARQRFDGYRGWLGTGAEREACLRASCSMVILYAR